MADPDLQIRGEGGGRGGHPDPQIRGWGGSSRPSDKGPGSGVRGQVSKKDPPLYKKTLKFQILNKGLIYIFSS